MGLRRGIFSKRAARVAGLAMAAVLSQAVVSQAAFSQATQEPAAAAPASAQSPDSSAAQNAAQSPTQTPANGTPAASTPATADQKPKRKSHIVREDRPKTASKTATTASKTTPTAAAVSTPAGATATPAAGTENTGGTATADGTTTTATPGTTATATLSNTTPAKAKKKSYITKDERVQQTKDTRAELRREKKYNPLVGKDADLPDKQLYDKALNEEKKGHFDVARLDLQTLLNTYPDSQYLMRSKLAVANSWFQEGGSAGLAQAEQEYGDFITFFPNVPEASEAQMRMGDIYLKQMDVPDRDYAKALKAEAQYRIMLKSYPDAPPAVHKEAEQKLRDVQEVLAQREYDLGTFYALRNNFAAAIARYQTVVDTYPLFSHMDDALIGLGDAYEAEAKIIRTQPLPEAAKAKLEEEYDGKSAAAYRDAVLNHAAAPHVEDAKERLQSMGLPLPTPTAEQIAASETMEGSRAQYTMRKRLELLFVRKPDTVTAAQIGAPPLEDATPTVAPAIIKQVQDDFAAAINPNAKPAAPATEAAADSAAAGTAAAPEAPAGSGAAPTLSDVPAAGSGAGDSTVSTVTEATPAANGGGASVGNGGASLGAEILTPGVNDGTAAPGTMTGGAITNRASDAAAATGKADPNYGLGAITPKPTDSTALPASEAAAPAPDAVNEAAGKALPAAQQKDPNKKKNPKPAFDKNDESSSKHKKKKGVDKLNPF